MIIKTDNSGIKRSLIYYLINQHQYGKTEEVKYYITLLKYYITLGPTVVAIII